MKTKFLSLLAVALLTATCMSCSDDDNNGETPATDETYTIKKFANNPLVAEVWWGQDYSEDAANDFLDNRYHYRASSAQKAPALTNKDGVGACSSWRKGNYHGRNIDWMMRDNVSLIVHMPKIGTNHAWVGVIAGSSLASQDMIDQNTVIPDSLRPYLPALVVDGINDAGVCINHNIVPYDMNKKPKYAATGDIASNAVCAYVLSHCGSAKAAVDALRNMAVAQTIVTLAGDYSHFFISDTQESYVVEWIENQFVATNFTQKSGDMYLSPNGNPAIMTNFFVGEAEKYGLHTNAFLKAHPMAEGIERYDIINSKLPDASTEKDHLGICQAVWFSPFCKGDRNTWASECYGSYGYDSTLDKAYWEYPAGSGVHYMENDSIYGAAMALMESGNFDVYYQDFSKGNDKPWSGNPYWYTQHSVVYDLQSHSGALVGMEGMYDDSVIRFSVE